MLAPDVVRGLADQLAAARRTHTEMPRISAHHSDATVADSYAIQRAWQASAVAAGRQLVGRKIGLTSRAMQEATGITEPDYGVILDDSVYPNGASVLASTFCRIRVEVELAFVLADALQGPDCSLEEALDAIDYAIPVLELLDSRIELAGRTIIDTIADNAAYGAMVLGTVQKKPAEIDLRWVPCLLYRNDDIIETGVAAGVLDHPVRGVAWLANKLHQHGERLEAGEIIMAGSFTRPISVERGDQVRADFGPMGTVTCRFV